MGLAARQKAANWRYPERAVVPDDPLVQSAATMRRNAHRSADRLASNAERLGALRAVAEVRIGTRTAQA